MASRFRLARGGAAVVGASVAMMMAAALPASADPATGKVEGGINGYNVDVGGDHDDIKTSLIGFALEDGTKLGMYCVEIDTRIDREHRMVEQPWDSYPNPDTSFDENRDQINWVLHNSYPSLEVDALAEALAAKGVEFHDGLDEKEAISATQAAVWHYSDGTTLNTARPLPNGDDEAGADVVALYEYLTGPDNTGIGEQPAPALEIAPGEISGKAGDRLGPFTVSTTGAISSLASELPEGVKITNKAGKEILPDDITNGTKLFLEVPKDAGEGAAAFELTATAGQDTGRLFIGERYAEKPTQSLVVATAETSEVSSKAVANWDAAPQTPTSQPTTSAPETTPQPTSEQPQPQPKADSDDLAETGASIFTPILIGVVLVGAGIGALVFQRLRKRA